MERKPSTSFRLSNEARDLLTRLARHLGISQTDVLELVIRQKAREEEINGGRPTRPAQPAAGE